MRIVPVCSSVKILGSFWFVKITDDLVGLAYANMVVDCQQNEDDTHPLTGTAKTFLEQDLGGKHKACFLAAVNSIARAVLQLLDAVDQPWICQVSMLEPSLSAMSSTNDTCCTTRDLWMKTTGTTSSPG